MATRACVLGLLVGLLAAPVVAADDDEGFHIGVQGSSVTLGNGDLILGVPVDPVEFGPGGNLVTIDFGSGTAVGGHLGWKGSQGDLTLAFWSYDEDAATTAIDPTNGFLPAFPNADFGDDFADRLDGSSNTETTIVDLIWTRPFAEADHSHWSWSIGLRSWSLEQDTLMTTDLDPGTDTFDDQVNLHSDADGIGLVAGIGASRELHKRLTGSANVRMAFLTGSIDASNVEDAFGSILTTVLDDADRNFLQLELEAQLAIRLGAGLDLILGYEFRQFEDATTAMFFRDDVQEGALETTTSDLTFAGFTYGLSYQF